MDIQAIEERYGIKVKPMATMLGEIRGQIRHFEAKYNLPSEKMLASIQDDPMRETEEICHWMQSYSLLKKITNGTGTAGIR